MSTIKKFYTMIGALLLLSSTSFAQNLLELPANTISRSGAITGNGFGPRTTNHVVFFDKDKDDNGKFDPQNAAPNAIAAPYNAVTFSFQNQQYASGFSYAGTPNPVTTGLVFGAGPDNADGVGPNGFGVQGVTPLNSYNLLGFFGGGNGGPKNGMFRSNYATAPNASPFPIQSGSGIDAEGLLGGPANDANGGAFIFTCAQRLYELGLPHNSATRHYMGDLVISFTRFMDNPVIHIAGLGGSFRYAPVGTDPANLATWVSTYFSTELELQDPSGLFTLTKMASNTFMTVSGDNITNNATLPNGESFDIGVPPAGSFNNFGAATGSVRVDGPPVRALRFRVYMRGANGSQFYWSAPGSATVGGNRNPVTGDIWGVSVSGSYCFSCIPLPAVGMKLDAALNGNDVLLNWRTESEIDTREFEIQRSTDGVNYSTIATKPAAGNSAVAIDYTHTDPNMQVSVYYYRLKLVDIDNDISYSNIAPVRKAGNVKGIRIYPNPAVSQLSVEFSNAKGDYIISLYNQAGQEVLTQKAIVAYGVQSIPVNRNNLPAGTYIMKVRNTNNGDVFNEKVVLQ